MDEYEVHPAADLFPMMSDAELDALGEDMLQNAQREPIILYKGKILDGRNRYRACLLKGINPKFREELPADPYTFVASANLHRRHLDPSQRAMIAAKLATLKRGARTDLAPAVAMSDADAATAMEVSERSVERAKTVRRDGAAELVHAVEQGEVSVSAAATFVRDRPATIQNEYIAQASSVAEAVKTANAEMRAAESANRESASGRKRRKQEPDVSAPGDRAEQQTTLAHNEPTKLIPNIDASRAAYLADVQALDLTFEQKEVEIRKIMEATGLWLRHGTFRPRMVS